MGCTREKKAAVREGLETDLADTQMVMVIDFGTLTVAEITKLRRQLRPSGTVCKVTKNTLMKKAIAGQPQWEPLATFLKGPSACLLVKKDIGEALKAYQAFAKETKKTELRGGVFDGRALPPDQLDAIAKLPPKEVLWAQIAGILNSVPSRLAGTLNEVPSSLGRAINEVPTSVARALKAYEEKQKEG